jgi:hypothetical protein
MSYVIAAPEMMTSAATDLATIGSDLSAAHTAAAAQTTGMLAAAEDEVSAAIASLFSSHGTAFQALSAQAATFHSKFVQALNAAARAYASTEAANAKPAEMIFRRLPDPNVAISVLGRTLVQLGTAHTSELGGLVEVAVGANSDATASGFFDSAFALGAGSDATALAGGVFVPVGSFNTAIAIGTNDVAVAGGSIGGSQGIGGVIHVPGSHDTAIVVGTGSTADAGASDTTSGNHDLAAVFGNMQTATATGANHLVDIVTPSGTAGGAAGTLIPNVAAAAPSPLVPNVAVSVFGHPLVQSGTAHTSDAGGIEIAVGANSDASANPFFNVALALGPGSDATVLGSYAFFPNSQFNSAVAIGTNDVAEAGGDLLGTPVLFEPFGGVPGNFDHAFAVGTGSTADAGANARTLIPGRDDIAAVFGDGLTATATGANTFVDIATPFGTFGVELDVIPLSINITL